MSPSSLFKMETLFPHMLFCCIFLSWEFISREQEHRPENMRRSRTTEPSGAPHTAGNLRVDIGSQHRQRQERKERVLPAHHAELSSSRFPNEFITSSTQQAIIKFTLLYCSSRGSTHSHFCMFLKVSITYIHTREIYIKTKGPFTPRTITILVATP